MSKGLPEGFKNFMRRDKLAWILDNYGSDWDEDERGRRVLDPEKNPPEDVVKAFEELRAEEDKYWKDGILID